jgi:hypothetical protein
MQAKKSRRLVYTILLLFPLLIGLILSNTLSDPAYQLLRHGQNIVAGRGLGYDGMNGSVVASLNAPLFVLAISLAGWMGVPLHLAAALLSGLGWGVTAVTLYLIVLRLKRPPRLRGSKQFTALLSAALLIFNPIVVITGGTSISWAVGFITLSLLLVFRQKDPKDFTSEDFVRSSQKPLESTRLLWLQTAVLALLLLSQFDLTIILLVLLFWLRQPRKGRLVRGTFLLGVGVVWGGLIWQTGLPFAPFSLSLIGGVTAVTVLFLLGLSIEWVANWLVTHKKVRQTTHQTALILTLLMGLSVSVVQASFLWSRIQLQPRAQQQLEQQAAVWLQQNSPESATIVASPRFGYLADRALQYDRYFSDPAALPAMLNQLIDHPPTYFITFRTLGATYLTQTGWFQERYQLARDFPSAIAGAPLLVWQQAPSPLAQTAPTTVAVRAEEKGLNLISYQIAPRRISPGEAIRVKLNWQSDQSPAPFLHTVVRLESPLDRVVWAQRDLEMPRSLPPEWIAADTTFPERFVLTTTTAIPVGAYLVTASLYHPREAEFVVLQQDGDENRLDRVTMGYLVVPWDGEMGETAVSLDATFAEQIKLLSCDCLQTAVSGQTISLRLYWEAMRPPDDNYVVFVHLLDDEGQLIVGHDAPPFGGRYDTMAWLPGDIIPDDHPLTLPPDLPSGRYTIRVGLYQPESGTRLSATDAQGNVSPEQSILLPTIQVTLQNN